jgi:RNA polymerase sigma-32 factor
MEHATLTGMQDEEVEMPFRESDISQRTKGSSCEAETLGELFQEDGRTGPEDPISAEVDIREPIEDEWHPLVRPRLTSAAPETSAEDEDSSRYDPLAAYMTEIRRYPLLSREEEHTLAVDYFTSRAPALRRRLITANLRLVVKLAYEYQRMYHGVLDLVQEGNLGLVHAVEKYDPFRGVKLSSFAAWWIRAYMLRFILDNWRLVRLGTTQVQRKLFFNLSKERKKLEAAGFVPTDTLLAQRLCVPEREVTDMRLRLGYSEVALDAPVGHDDTDGRTAVELLEGKAEERPDVQAEGRELHSWLLQQLGLFQQTLKGSERTLFSERLISEQPLTLQQVGARHGISRERARQIEAKMLTRLRSFLSRQMAGDGTLDEEMPEMEEVGAGLLGVGREPARRRGPAARPGKAEVEIHAQAQAHVMMAASAAV